MSVSVFFQRTFVAVSLSVCLGGLLLTPQPGFSQNGFYQESTQASMHAAAHSPKYPMSALIRSTRDQGILEAFYRMPGTEAEAALDKIVKKPVRVFFKDLGQLSKQLKDYDALSWLSPDGQHVVFVNIKHQGSPPEALAAIIAHEVIHDDGYNSVNEEVAGWQQEAVVWHGMKSRNPSLANIPEGKYPLVDRLNRIESEWSRGGLAGFVANNPGYKGLPEESPGFFHQSEAPEQQAEKLPPVLEFNP